MENKNNLPEYIKGIPTAKNRSGERMVLIKTYYVNLWRKLQREGLINKIYNDYLGVHVYVIQNRGKIKKSTVQSNYPSWEPHTEPTLSGCKDRIFFNMPCALLKKKFKVES